MIFESKEEDGTISIVADGYLMNAPSIEEVLVNEKPRKRCKFFLKYGYAVNLEGKKSSKTIACTIWNKEMIEVSRALGQHDNVIVFGVKTVDKNATDRLGRPYYNIQVSSILPIRLLMQLLLSRKEARRYEKGIMEVYKKSNQENMMSVNYAGEPDRLVDVGF